MTARNEFTGDLIKTKFNTKQYQENLEKIYGNKPSQKGKFRQCRETGDMLPMDEWLAKYGSEPRQKTPMIICNNFDPFVSPVSDRVISSKRQHQEDLAASGCRVYEGREQETKEADKWQKEQESKIERNLEKTLHTTMHEIEHGYRSENG